MRLATLLALGCLLSSCNATALVDDTVPEIIRDATHTFGDEQVRHDIETFALSPEVQRILTQLTHDLVATIQDSVHAPDLEASLRALIATAVDELRHDTADLPPAMSAALDDLLRDAEAMVGRVVGQSLHQLRAMLDGDDVSLWVRGLLRDVLTDLWSLASSELDDASAEHLGRWMHVVLREVLADVELEEGTSRMARAAAHGLGDGIADSLNGPLGDVLHRERDDLVERLQTASEAAARPWEVAAGFIAIAALALSFLWFRSHQAHQATKVELETLKVRHEHTTGGRRAQ